MDIPVRNIYYLLNYAWDSLLEGEICSAGIDDYDKSINLFARALLNGCNVLLKRGVVRNYVSHSEEYPGIKGKILFAESIKRNSFQRAKGYCESDTFTANIEANQYIKSTLHYLLGRTNIDNHLRQQILQVFHQFSDMSLISVKRRMPDLRKLQRERGLYKFLHQICFLLLFGESLSEDVGDRLFIDFLRDKGMPRLFERFLFNFYRKEQADYAVSRDYITWDARAITSNSLDYLPRMMTDITLSSRDRKIIIDAKFYAEMMSSRFDSEKFHSANLYQIFAYMRNLEADSRKSTNQKCEGVLLYPKTVSTIDERFELGGHVTRVVTLDLTKSWREIHSFLLQVLEPIAAADRRVAL